MNRKIKNIVYSLGLFVIIPVSAQNVDYSKIKPNKEYIYEGDIVRERKNSRDTSKSPNKTSAELNAELNVSARDKSNSKIKALKDKEQAIALAKLEAEKKKYNFNSNKQPSNEKFHGYNQLISDKEDYKHTQFDPNYLNGSKNPFALQKSGKYKHLFNNPNQSRFCWDQAANYYGLDPWLLFAVAKVESSFNANAINKNNDKSKSTDYGLMQINTFWLPTLAKYGISKEHLFDPCTSIFVGAWIMKSNIQRLGYNIDGIGAYNSPHNLQIRRKYGNKVINAYKEVIRDFGYTH